ncbi:MAG: hypothetical protein IIW66_03265 [Bacteroidales bacterium]|nr:hypothetical protein [Bacteroidales bacterium]MBQ5864396.1 hypothetical protein [Bacteroidales bacterium]
MANPIWKDYYVNLGTAESIQFRILVGDDVIYTGKAYKRPGQTNNEIRINDICADYLEYVFPNLSQMEFTEIETPVSFVVQIYSGSDWVTWETVQFYNNWSYDYDYNPVTMGMSFPVNGNIDISQWIVFSAYDASSITATISLFNGDSFDVIIPVAISNDFNADFNSDFSKSIRGTQTGTAVFNLSQWGDVKSLTIGDKVFKVVNKCHKYVLYYINAYGGWDSLLIEGNHIVSDKIIRHTRETEYDNRNIQNRGKHNYVNEITKSMTLHTSWLSDEESLRMHHLLNSTEVYLYDMETKQMIPVILSNSTTDYKTYKSNGGKLVNYAIEVEYANTRLRR